MSISFAPASPSPHERGGVLTRLSNWISHSRRGAGETQFARDEAPTNEALDQIGAENEEIKNRCVEFIRKIDELSTLRENFVEISKWFGQILAAREQTNATLIERGVMIALAEGALADLKAETRALYDCKEEALAENSLLRAENECLKASARGREARIEAVETELQAATEAMSQLRQNFEAEQSRHVCLRDELLSAQTAIQNNEALISQLRTEVAAAREESAIARQHDEQLQAALLESRENPAKIEAALRESQIQADGLADKLREMEAALASEQRQVSSAEERLAASRSEHLKEQTRWREEKEEDRRRIAELEAKVEKLAAQAQAGDQLLQGARAQLRSKLDERRAGERRSKELEQKLARLTKHSDKIAREAAQLRWKLNERTHPGGWLSGRAKSLIRSMRDIGTAQEKSGQKPGSAAERQSVETGRFEEEKTRLEQAARDLAEQMGKGLTNVVTVGALEAARRQRLQPPREETKLADILARAEEAHNAAEAEAAALAERMRR